PASAEEEPRRNRRHSSEGPSAVAEGGEAGHAYKAGDEENEKSQDRKNKRQQCRFSDLLVMHRSRPGEEVGGHLRPEREPRIWPSITVQSRWHTELSWMPRSSKKWTSDGPVIATG